MPNGVSCAYFAIKNYEIGKRDSNIFRTGIAGAQTARTLNCASKAASIVDNTSKFGIAINKIANFARKILYPLIICSGVYTTVKSNDKVKTGVSQASAISTMYLSEQVTERLLKNLDEKVLNMPAIKKNKYLRWGYLGLKGCTYAAASIFGYNQGNKLGSSSVDRIREIKAHRTNSNSVGTETENDIYESNEDIFDDIESEAVLKQYSENH